MKRQLPGRDEIERARALLQEIATRDPGGALGRGLTRFGSWRSLAAVLGTDWLPLPRRPSPSTARLLRQRLRALGAAPPRLALETKLEPGEPMQLQGTAARLPGDDGPELWRALVIEDETGRWAVDEGRDFILRGLGGALVLVRAQAGRLVNAERLTEGDEVAVFGLADELPDRVGLARTAHGRGAPVPALRSGPTHPLLVSVIRRYDQADDGPQD